MDLTQGTSQEKQKRAKKMMLWFGIVSLIMSFAGLTSAFIVSSSREDWLANFVLPNAFTYSTLIILLSSISFICCQTKLKKEPSHHHNISSYWSISSWNSIYLFSDSRV